jgi:hypothetical protein
MIKVKTEFSRKIVKLLTGHISSHLEHIILDLLISILTDIFFLILKYLLFCPFVHELIL